MCARRDRHHGPRDGSGQQNPGNWMDAPPVSHTIVFVSGAPGSGKTALAHPLAEANFLSAHPRAREQLTELTARGRLIEVHCACPPEEAARRYDARGAGTDRHPVHSWRTLPAEVRAQYTGPLALGPVIEVDTTRPVNVTRIAARVLKLLGMHSR